MNRIIIFLIIVIVALGGYMYSQEKKSLIQGGQYNINTGSGLISGSGDPMDETTDETPAKNIVTTQSGSFTPQDPETPLQEVVKQGEDTKTTEDESVRTNDDIAIETKNELEDIPEVDPAEKDEVNEEEVVEDDAEDDEDEGGVADDPEPEPASPYNKALYMWSAPFGEHSSSTIVDFINDQGIDNAIISMNQSHTSRINKMAVINTLNSQGKSIEAMLSKNSIIDASDDAILDYVESVFSGSFNFSAIDRIHLDIEPHVRDDWHDNKTAYLDKYMNMLDIIKNYADENGVGISVSIPLHYPIEYTNQIFDAVDIVYFMAYENVSVSHITRKTSEYLPTYRSKINIALRTNDFDNSTELHALADVLLSDMDLDDYTIHDFQSLKAFIDAE